MVMAFLPILVFVPKAAEKFGSLGLIGPVSAILLGNMSLVWISVAGDNIRGKWMARASIILGVSTLLFIGGYFWFIFNGFVKLAK